MKNQHTFNSIIRVVLMLFVYSASYAQFAHKINKQRRYDEISWLVTHNAYNNRTDGPSGFFGCLGGGNQSAGILKQLQDGVRSFMVDMYRVNGQLRLKHGSPNQCMMDAKKFNTILADWLKTHPQDIITLHIESGPNLGKSGLDDIFFGRISGYKNISSFIYNHSTFVSAKRPAGSGSDVYPTIQEMLNRKKQLVIFTERNYNNDLYRYEFEHTVQNKFRAGQVSHLLLADKFVKDRGVDHKTILTVNHFAGDAPTYNGDVNKSKEANKGVQKKAITAWLMFGHKPSIAVDYYNLSDGTKAMTQIDNVNKINEVRGRFIDKNNPGKHVRNVKTYFAELKNGVWKKIKNIEHDGRRGSWHVQYSFPARSTDDRAIFFEHSGYSFNPSHVKIGDFKGNNSKTFTKNIVATAKSQFKIQSEPQSKATNALHAEEAKVSHSVIYPNTLRNNDLTIAYNHLQSGQMTLGLYDLSGLLIETLTNTKTVSGSGKVAWEFKNKDLKGIYIVKGVFNNTFFSRKVVLGTN